jgi:hypothetical protein
VTIPVTGVGARTDRGQSIITVDVKAVHKYVRSLVTGRPQAPPPPATPSPAASPAASPPTAPSAAKLTGAALLDLNAAGGRAAVPCVD